MPIISVPNSNCIVLEKNNLGAANIFLMSLIATVKVDQILKYVSSMIDYL